MILAHIDYSMEPNVNSANKRNNQQEKSEKVPTNQRKHLQNRPKSSL